MDRAQREKSAFIAQESRASASLGAEGRMNAGLRGVWREPVTLDVILAFNARAAACEWADGRPMTL